MDRTSGLFVNEKMDMLLVRILNGILETLRCGPMALYAVEAFLWS